MPLDDERFARCSDEELDAALLLLGEQAQQLTIATELVRAGRSRRAIRPDPEKMATFTDFGESALAEAIAGAPAKAVAVEAARQAAEAARQAAEAAAEEERRLAIEAADAAAVAAADPDAR